MLLKRSTLLQNSYSQKYQKMFFQDQLSLNTLSTFIELPFVIKPFVLFIFEWPLYSGFTVLMYHLVAKTGLSI